MNAENLWGRTFCEACERRFDDPGDCPRCDDESLMDLTDDDVLLMLESLDDATRRKRYSLCFVGGFVVAIPATALVFAVSTLTGFRFVDEFAIPAGFSVLAGTTTALTLMSQPTARSPGMPSSTRWIGRLRRPGILHRWRRTA